MRPKNIAYTRPGGAGFPNLSADRLDVIIILREKAPEIFEDIDPLKHSVMNGELLT